MLTLALPFFSTKSRGQLLPLLQLLLKFWASNPNLIKKSITNKELLGTKSFASVVHYYLDTYICMRCNNPRIPPVLTFALLTRLLQGSLKEGQS